MAMILEEQIDLRRACWAQGLTDEEFETTLWREGESNQGEKEMSKETHIREIRKMLTLHLETAAPVKVKYDFSKNMKSEGRLFVKGYGLAKMKRIARGFFCSKYYNDYDMKNAHPTILRYILKTFYKCDFETDFPALNDYITKRDQFLEAAELHKDDVFKLLNASYDREMSNSRAAALNEEFLQIQNQLWFKLPPSLQMYSVHKKTGNNKKGKFINVIMTIFENIILMDVLNYYQSKYPEDKHVSGIVFDGFHLSNSLPDQTEILNEVTKKYGIVWSIKKFNDEIENSDLFLNADPPSYESTYQTKSYETIKKKFEETHFMVRKPIGFVETTGDDYYTYNSRDFQYAVGHHKFIDTAKGKCEEQSIFNRWVQDPEKREYFRIDFHPSLEGCPKGVFNTFKGFAYKNYHEVDFEEKEDAIELFKKQISILVNHEEHVKEYFINYFAHMFQKPTEIPGVALILKSDEGWGKDLLTDLLAKLLGEDLMLKTEDMGLIFDKFNGSIKNKMLIHLNELTAKDGFGNKDSLKGKITAPFLNIQEKGKETYKQANYARWIAATNNLTPIEVKADSRRFVIVQADPVKPSSNHFDAFIKMMKDKDSLFTIMEYLMNVDLSNFKVRDIPHTEIAKNMKYRNTAFIYFFMKELVTNDKYKDMFDAEDVRIKSNQIIIKKSIFKREYENYCIDNGFPWQHISWSKQVVPLLNAIGITTRKKSRFDDLPISDIRFNIQEVTNSLVNKIVKEDDE